MIKSISYAAVKHGGIMVLGSAYWIRRLVKRAGGHGAGWSVYQVVNKKVGDLCRYEQLNRFNKLN